jgi:hypothetical protein
MNKKEIFASMCSDGYDIPIIEFFSAVCDDDLKQKLLYNCRYPHTMTCKFSMAIAMGFVWESTPEGVGFWTGVYEAYRGLGF